MKTKIISEINQMRKMMGLQEQSVIDATKSGIESGVKGTDDEYKMMGYIVTFMDMEGPNDTFDEKSDWISKYRAPIGKFGVTLFDYLHGKGTNYDKNYFNKLMKVFNTPDIFKTKPTYNDLIELGKKVENFRYNN